jgi:hypothetical protein
MKAEEIDWKEGSQGSVTVQTTKDVRIGIGTPGETTLPKGTVLNGGFGAKGSVVVYFKSDELPSPPPAWENDGLVTLWEDEYEIVVGDGEVLVKTLTAVNKITTNGDDFEAGPECSFVGVLMGNGDVLCRLDPARDCYGDEDEIPLDSFVLNDGEWTLLDGTLVHEAMEFFAKDAPFPVWYGEPFTPSNIGGCVLFQLEAPIEEFKKVVRGAPGCLSPRRENDGGFSIASMINEKHSLCYDLMGGLAFLFRELSDGVGEVFYRGGDTMFYAQVTVRFSSMYNTNDQGQAIIKWLRRRAKKNMERGRRGAIKDAISVRAAEASYLCNHVIPIGMENPAELIIPGRCFVARSFLASFEETYGEGTVKKIVDGDYVFLAEEMLFIRSLEKSDTPIWISPSDDLTLMLLNTQPSMLDESDVRLVAPAIFIELPRDVFVMCDFDMEPGLADVSVDGISLYETVAENGERILVVGLLSIIKGRLAIQNRPFPFSVLLKEDYSDVKGVKWKICGEMVADGEFTKKIMSFILNVLFYISSQSSSVKRSVVRKNVRLKTSGAGKKRKQKVGVSLYEELVIGTEVVLSDEAKRVMRNSASGGWKISYSFLVRGHWRNQACGPNRSMRVRKWIEPYVKGKDLASRIIGHSYVD